MKQIVYNIHIAMGNCNFKFDKKDEVNVFIIYIGSCCNYEKFVSISLCNWSWWLWKSMENREEEYSWILCIERNVKSKNNI